MKNILEYIRSEIAKVCVISQEIPFVCEYPRDKSHGDFATNIAMIASKIEKISPMGLAEKFLPLIKSLPFVRECTVAKPAFINIRVENSIFLEMMETIVEAKNLPDIGKAEKINIEYVSANPTGPLHVGHLRGAIYGDVLATLLLKTGFDVTKEYYINDAGNQIDVLGKSVFIRYSQLLGENIEVPEGCYPAEYIVDIAREIRSQFGDDLQENDAIFQKFATEWNLSWVKSTLAKLKIKHDIFSSEKEIVNSDAISKAFAELLAKNLIYKAIPEKPRSVDLETWEPLECTLFRTKDFGDSQDRVVQKNNGSYTYCVPDMVYNRNKINRGFNNLVMVLGADHLGYVSRLQAMTKAIATENFNLDIKICQIVKFLKDGEAFKMSKRAGNFVTVDDILESVHVDILRFIMLTKKNDVHMDFDVEKVKEQTKENPIFYIQYAYSRISSILRKFQENNIVVQSDFSNSQINENFGELVRKIVEFPSILAVAVKNHEPHHLAFYAYSLAGELHSTWTLGNANQLARFMIEGNDFHNQSSLNIILSTKKVFESIFDIFNIEPLTSM
jgi:arginyl-tRNA synthetase